MASRSSLLGILSSILNSIISKNRTAIISKKWEGEGKGEGVIKVAYEKYRYSSDVKVIRTSISVESED